MRSKSIQHHYYVKAFLSCVFLFNSLFIFAQINNQTNVGFLKENSLFLTGQMKNARAKAFAMAKEKNWETFKVNKDGSIISLQGVDDMGLPVYYITYNNSIAAASTATNKLYSGGSLGLNLSGSSIPTGKVAIWDGGSILASHVEFANNRVEVKDLTTSVSAHATHVGGTMIASGLYPAAKGMAFGLPKLFSFDFNSDIAEMSAHASTLLISNHSYGVIAGWRYNESPARWEFWGNVGSTEDYKFGYYNDDAKDWDAICYNAPYYLPVKSAGNNRSENGPAVGEAYYRFNESGTIVAAGNRPVGISSNDSYDIISTYGNAKNILTVGAVNPLPYGAINPSNITISSFSSWGPTDDGRIKPDIVGDGVSVTSTSSATINAYATLSGTSMSSPNVSGSLILLQELYNQKNNVYMRAATLKGLVLATATDAGLPGPDYIYGWGLLNTAGAAKAILTNGDKSIIAEKTIAQGEHSTFNVVASGNGPLVITICWTDPEATVIPAANALNNRTPRLVNDLDIKGLEGTTNYLPWVLNPALPALAATTGDNVRDNVEQIYIPDAVPGKSYAFTVSHKGTLLRGPQAYAIIMTGIGGTPYCSSAPIANADSKITNFKLANIDYTPANNCTTYSDFTNQTIAVEKNKTYPFAISLGTCGNSYNKMAKLFIDWNNDGDFNDDNELIATSSIISGNGVFAANVVVPATVVPANYSRLRIVLSETEDPNSILPCGTYEKGETQDYRIKFLNMSSDVAVVNVVSPTAGACASTQQYVKVSLKNFGSQDVNNFPITATVKLNGTTISTLTGILTQPLLAGAEKEFTFKTPFVAEAGKTYVISAKTNLPTDQNTANDEFTSGDLPIHTPTNAVIRSTAYYCANTNNYIIDATAEETLYWYKNDVENVPFAFGNSVTTAISPSNGQYFYGGLNDYKSGIGPSSKNDVSLGAGTYLQTTGAVYVNTKAPMLLESAKLYIGTSGTIKFSVKNSDGMEVSNTVLDVTATRSQPIGPITFPLTNDLTDPGEVYPLNLAFPAAGDYTISISYENGASIFRNNGGASGITYPISSALSMFAFTGNNASPASSFYYYFYDVKVKALACPGASRLAVPISKAVVTQVGVNLTSNLPVGNQWFLNGKKINGAVDKDFTPQQNGKYAVENTLASGCIIKSEVYDFTYVLTSTNEDEINLKLFPVPASAELNFSIDVLNKANLKIRLINTLGQVAYNFTEDNFNGRYVGQINLAEIASGTYVFEVFIGKKKYAKKVMITH